MYVDAVVVSTQHDEGVDHADLSRDVIEKVIKAVIPADLLRPETKFYVNPTGSFVIGGPHGDSGVTGRKIIVDTYGGACPHGGGAFSGKDPTKVDRSACYYARYACKNIVAAGLADRVQMQVAYAIGKAEPVSLCVDTFGTSKYPDSEISRRLKKCSTSARTRYKEPRPSPSDLRRNLVVRSFWQSRVSRGKRRTKRTRLKRRSKSENKGRRRRNTFPQRG